jgi:hypothetical protein
VAAANKPFDPLDYRTIGKSVVDGLLAQTEAPLPPAEPFEGAGIYALYHYGAFEAYAPISGPESGNPIYVGKAVPSGSRVGRDDPLGRPSGRPLHGGLTQHARSIEDARNLDVADFRCRYLVVQPVWIRLAEKVLLDEFRPVWNTVLDGFGNHPPGRGRSTMRRPRWDIVHPGRSWAERLTAEEEAEDLLDEVRAHLAVL